MTFDEESGLYGHGPINWEEFYQVIKGNGPLNRERLAARRKALDEGRWVREAAMSYAEKKRENKLCQGDLK